ncbi:SRPBCC family protein [Brucella thiophenivorans]|uniref:Activator of Hsp90 ATPase homologue 1/2-like C-terminal domain-containing protein n=1 Tax=Brucella thiophenivorans TaxID=571255 RepID=A0A256FZK9_9HYPH|nr:SRPBCC domain-containing protein [Brucella thiophenivorans]OYR20272.1 hypothetical protein CEV31_1698 [Brucella thiophenivorans]
MSELELTVNRRIAAPREKIFDAWLSPSTLANFMRVPPDSVKPSDVKTDAVKGGRFSILMHTVDRDVMHTGTYLEIKPHSRLSFTWSSPHSPDDSVVTVDLTEVDANTTDVTLNQVKFRSQEEREGHTRGWTAILANFDQLAQ